MRQQKSIEVQTDINLIHQPVTHAMEQYQGRSFGGAQIEGLIQAHTDSQLLSFFKQEATFFRGLGHVENLSEEDLRKRLTWIENQIEGLEKRNVSVNGKNYYDHIGDLQSQLERQIVISNNWEPLLREANRKIADLEKQVFDLRRGLIDYENVKVENDKLKDTMRQVSQVIRNPQRMKQIQRTVNQKLVPLLDQFDIKFDAMLKNVSSVGRGSTDTKSRLKAHLNTFLKNVERICKGTEEITLNNVEAYIRTFLKDLEVSETYEQHEKAKLYKYQLQELQRKFESSIRIFKNSFQQQISRQPFLRNMIDLSIFDSLQSQIVQVHNFNQVITLEGVNWGGRKFTEYTIQDQESKRMLSLLRSQLKALTTNFPFIKQHLRAEVVDLVDLEVFDDAIFLDELDRLTEVIKYKTEVVKVENVYTYNNETHLKTIFHLKVMIKSLIGAISSAQASAQAKAQSLQLNIDEGLLGMMRAQFADFANFVNPDDVLRVFRSVPKILEVQKIVERNLYRPEGMMTQAHAVKVEIVMVADRIIQRPVTLKQQVGITIEKPISIPVIHQVPINFVQQVAIQVPVIRQVVVDRNVFDQRIVQVEVIKEVPFIQTEFQQVQTIVTQTIETEVPVDVVQQVPVTVTNIVKEVQIVDRFQQRLVEVTREVTNVRQVKVIEQVPVEQIRYIQVERIVNNFINVPQIVETKTQVAVPITNTIQRPVDVIHTIEKIVQITNTQEKIVQVPVKQTQVIVQQIPKPYKEEVTVFIKGDKEEVLVHVDRIVEKPIIREVLKITEVLVQKAVPVWMREEKPVVVQLSIPYIQNEIDIVTVEREIIVPYKQEVPLEVTRQVPVPIICQREVIRPIRIIVQKIVQKMVEVPRVVEVQKIVEKIVIVPRVIENIVQVPQIIEKIVQREVPILRIVELERFTPQYMIKEVKEIIQQIRQKAVEKVIIQTVDKQKIVYINRETQVIKTVEVERQVPIEVIRQREVPVIQQRIVERVLTVREVQFKDREVVIPFRHEIPVQVIQQKLVEVQKIIQTLVQVPQKIETNRILYEIKTQLQLVELSVEKVIQIIKEVVYTDTKNIIEYQPQYVDIVKQVPLISTEIRQVIKPEPYIVEKVVVVNEIHQSAVPVYLEKAVVCREQVPVVITKSVPVAALFEVPKELVREKAVQVRTVVENNRQIPVSVQKLVTLQNIRPEVVQTTQQILKVIVEHEQKEVVQQIAIIEERNNVIEVPSQPIIVQEYREIYREINEPLLLQKVVERVTLLPQIVEVLRHIHEITEQNISGIGVGIAQLGIDVKVHTADYISICTGLRSKLEATLLSMRNSRLPEARDQVSGIEDLIKLLGSLISFPNIVQIPRIIERQKIVLVPTKDTEALNRQIAATTLIEKLVAELKRVKSEGVKIRLEDQVMDIFFLELKTIQRMDNKLRQFSNVVMNRFRSLGNWTEEHSLMLNNFLQERFLMAGIVKESNDTISLLKRELEVSQTSRQKHDNALTKLSIINVGLKNSLSDIIETLKQAIRTQTRKQPELEALLSRAEETLGQFQTNILQESRFRTVPQDGETLRVEIRNLQRELESYRGGDEQRNNYLSSQITTLKNQNQNIQAQNLKLRRLADEKRGNQNIRDVINLTRDVETLNRTIVTQREEFDRTLKRTNQDHQRQLASYSKDPRVLTSTVMDRSQEEERLRGVQRSLEQKIFSITEQLNQQINNRSQNQFTIAKLQNQIRELKKKIQEQKTTKSTSGISQATGVDDERWKNIVEQRETKITDLNVQLQRNETKLVTSRRELETAQHDILSLNSQLRQKIEEGDKMKRLLDSRASTDRGGRFQYGQEPDRFRSPEVRQGDQQGPETPAAQLRMTSPQMAFNPQEESESSSSRIAEQLSVSQTYGLSRNITIRNLIAQKLDDASITKIMILLVDKIDEECRHGRFLLYDPENIILQNYNPDALGNIKIILRDPITINSQSSARKYLPPEVLNREPVTEKSCLFNIAVIWDELLHETTYYRNEQEVKEAGNTLTYSADYKVRNSQLNPIYKNALFEMIKKDPKKRIEFKDIKQRLSLQKYINLERNT